MSWVEYDPKNGYKNKIRRRAWNWAIIPIILSAAIISVLAYIIIGESTGAITYHCVKTVTVVDILSVNYRSATILTEDNEEIELNQETFTIGDEICVKYKKETDWSKI